MVRASKTDKQSAAPVPAPVVSEPVVKKATKKTKPVVETAQVPAVEASAAPVNEVVEPVDSSVTLKMNEFGAKIQQAFSIFSSLKGDFKTLERTIARELKAAAKSSAKKTKRSGNRQPSGFVKPTRISDELATFLGKTSGTQMARTEVSKEINAYIRANKLQDPTNGRKINPDAKLKKLLALKATDELTYFNLQRFMSPHVQKATPATATA
jgi:chromatin remodeling complex protein RSC6